MPRGIPRNQSTQRKILHRLKIAKGHLEKVIKMVEEDDYCMDIVHQSRALQAALRKTDEALLSHHLENCVIDQIQKGKTQEVVSEVMEIVKKS